MAKKGATQLQTEINTDEEFDSFLEKNHKALIVLDVFTEWCGPMLSALNALRSIKMQMGGDSLQLALCKCDNLTRLRRFYKKSEPTWLFVREGKSVNIQLGADIPKLMDLIKRELDRLHTPIDKMPYIGIEELHPEERKRLQTKLDIADAIERKERLEREKKRLDYLTFCTDTIMDNLPDVGVTIFGPQVSKDIFKKLNEPAEAMKISCKDKRFQFVTKEDFDIVNYACRDPLPKDVIEELTKQEIFICFWKISEEVHGTVPQVMSQYMKELTKKVVEPPDEFYPYERVTPPIIESVKLKISYEVELDTICPVDEDDLAAKGEKRGSEDKKADDEMSAETDFYDEEEQEAGEGAKEEPAAPPAMETNVNFGDAVDDAASSELVEEEEEVSEGPPPTKYCTKTVHMPAVWSPSDERTQAALIYVFFRAQTLSFLPPDPPPEPPHVIMAFDSYKKRDLISIAERNKDEIPCYGFFTSDEADDAKFIANSVQKYARQPATTNDKLVFKVNKKTSHMMLSLVSYGASYVSPNTTVGKEEALKFFPADYRTAEQDRLEALEAQKKEDEQSGKGKKAVKSAPAEAPVATEVEAYDVEDIDHGADRGEGDGGADEGHGGEGDAGGGTGGGAGGVAAEGGGNVPEGGEEAADVGGGAEVAEEGEIEEAPPPPQAADAA